MAADSKIRSCSEEAVEHTDNHHTEWVVANTLHVEQTDSSSAIIFLSDTGARLRIPRPLYNLVLRFEAPARIDAVAGGNAKIASALQALTERGFLVSPSRPASNPSSRIVTDPPVRLFDCPARKAGGGATDVAIIGVPYDFGDREAAGARHGPAALRDTSLQLLYRTHKLTGEPLGWFDADSARHILRGVTIGDSGDVQLVHGEPQSATFERISAVVDEALAVAALPVILGGDVTVSFPAIRALAVRQPLAVVRIGQRSNDCFGPGQSFVAAPSLRSWLCALPAITTVLEIDADACQGDAHDQIARIPASMPVYLSFDMSAIVGGHGIFNGGEYAMLCALIDCVGTSRPVCGLDIVGLNSRHPRWGMIAMTALHLLLQTVSAAKDHRELEQAA